MGAKGNFPREFTIESEVPWGFYKVPSNVFSSLEVIHLIFLCFESVVCEKLKWKSVVSNDTISLFKGAFASSLSHVMVLRKMRQI